MSEWPPFVDTNVLLRLLLADHEEHSPGARRYFHALQREGRYAAVLPTTISEVVFVLRAPQYGKTPEEAAAAIERILDLPLQVADREVVEQALRLYRDVHPDWDDALLAAYALSGSDGRLVSFDTRLDRIPGIERVSPLATDTE